MTRMLDTIKKPNIWLIVSVVYIWLFGLSVLVASIGPPYVISKIANKSFSMAGLEKAILIYAQEGATRLGYKYEYILYALIANVLILVPVIILSFFILRRKLWALNTSIILIFAYIVQSVGLGLIISESVFDTLNLNIAILVAITYFFMKKSTRAIFNEKRI